jgi:hypothetical protein
MDVMRRNPEPFWALVVVDLPEDEINAKGSFWVWINLKDNCFDGKSIWNTTKVDIQLEERKEWSKSARELICQGKSITVVY